MFGRDTWCFMLDMTKPNPQIPPTANDVLHLYFHCFEKKLWKHVSTACMTTRPPGKVWNNLNLERNNLSLHLIFLGTNISLYHIWKRKIIGSQLPFFQGICFSSLEANLCKAPAVFFPTRNTQPSLDLCGPPTFVRHLAAKSRDGPEMMETHRTLMEEIPRPTTVWMVLKPCK